MKTFIVPQHHFLGLSSFFSDPLAGDLWILCDFMMPGAERMGYMANLSQATYLVSQ